jgi:hypothetical protein
MSTQPRLPTRDLVIPRAIPRIALIVLCAFNALSAIGGGAGMLTPGSIGMPLSTLKDSPFTSFFWPALILVFVVGGTQVLALVAVLRKGEAALFWPSVAGCGLMIWIFVEVSYMDTIAIHVLYFATALGQLALVVALLGVLPRIVPRAAHAWQ